MPLGWNRPLSDNALKRLCEPLGISELVHRRRIAHDVEEIARVSLHVPRPPTLAEVRRELELVLDTITSGNGVLALLSEDARNYLEAVSDDWHFRDSKQSVILVRIMAAVALVKQNLVSRNQHKGGRPSDPRNLKFVTSLAQIYIRRTGDRPTHTVHPDSGEPTSRFDQFVLEATRLFYPLGEVPPWAAIEAAIRQTVAFERDTQSMTPKDYAFLEA